MSKSKQWLLTIFFALGWAFVIGLLILFLLTVPLEAYLSEQLYAQSTIDLLMLLPIVLWFLLSGMTGFLYYFWLPRAGRNQLLAHFTTLLVLVALSAVFLLSDNSLLTLARGTTAAERRFVFGPYPDAEQIRELRQQGIQDIITLLNPAIPFEKALLEREQDNCQALGLRLHSFPMLPWVSNNKTALEGIQTLIKTYPNRTFYIHCYLGRHRVDLVRKLLSAVNETNTEELYLYPDQIERGSLYLFANGKILLGPYPTDEEWFNLIQRGQINRVVSWLNPADPDDRPWLEKEQKICQELGLQFLNLSLSPQPTAAELQAWAKILTRPEGKLYLHGFRHDQRSLWLAAFLQQGRWPAPNQLPDLRAGIDLAVLRQIQPAAEVVTGHLLAGPGLEPAQMSGLKQAGLTTIILLAGRQDLSEAEISRLKQAARQVGLNWETVAYRSGYEKAILRLVNQGQPCYVLTTAAGKLQIAQDLGKYKL